MTNHFNKELVMELESMEPEELVSLFGLTSDQLIRAFPGHAYDYVRDNFNSEYEDEPDIDIDEELDRIENYEGFGIVSDTEA